MGIANIEARLRRYYGEDASFTLNGAAVTPSNLTLANATRDVATHAGTKAELRVPILAPAQLEILLKAAS